MTQTEFKSQKELQDYAERNGLEYAWEYAPAFAKRQRLLSSEQYELVEVRTTRGVSRADFRLLSRRAILRQLYRRRRDACRLDNHH
jgi:hypothetical protein